MNLKLLWLFLVLALVSCDSSDLTYPYNPDAPSTNAPPVTPAPTPAPEPAPVSPLPNPAPPVTPPPDNPPTVTTNVGKLVSPLGMDFILDNEISCSTTKHSAYDRLYQAPTWPEGSSGVTIAVGYDLGYEETYQYDWQPVLSSSDYAALKAVCGLTGSAARARISSLAEVLIPWSQAYGVFNVNQLPREYIKTARMYPGLPGLSLNAQSALVDLEYNRGTSLFGPSRAEMLAIKDLVPKDDLQGIAKELIAMERVWAGSSIQADMDQRRAGEAKLLLTPDSQ